MKHKIISITILSIFGILSLGSGPSKEIESGEPFTETQIQMLQSEVNIPREKKPIVKKAEVVVTETVVPDITCTYVYLDEIPWDEDMQEFCQERCRFYKIGYAFFLAMAESESSFRWPSTEDNIGFMQINKVNINRYPELDVYDPYDNLEAGIRIMAELKNDYMSFDQIIMGYKGGESAMLEWVGEDFRLPICDQILERTNYYQQLIDEEKSK